MSYIKKENPRNVEFGDFLFTKKIIISYLYQKLITKKERKAKSILSKNL